MNQDFENDEKLFRAVYPPEIAKMYWKTKGELSSAAFADKRGLSVDRGADRSDSDAVSCMLSRLMGYIVSVSVGICRDAEAEVYFMPSKSNPYHTEIHGSKDTVLLSKHQRRFLVLNATIEFSPKH